MGKNVRMKIEFLCMRQGVPCNALQFTDGYKVAPNKEKNIIKVSIQTAIQFAERNAIWIGNVDFQIPELTNAYAAFLISPLAEG